MLPVIICFMLMIPTISYGKTTIDSDQLDVNFHEGIATFKGNVQLVSDDFNFSADRVEITLLDNSHDLSKVKMIKAMSQDQMINGNISRDKTTYNLQCREIMIDMVEKTITAIDGTFSSENSRLSGEKIIYNITDGKVIVSGKKQVKISIEDEDKKAG